jgi:hypothetical protein
MPISYLQFCGLDNCNLHMIGDEGWNAKSRAYQTGYLQGLLRAVTDLGAGNTGV